MSTITFTSPVVRSESRPVSDPRSSKLRITKRGRAVLLVLVATPLVLVAALLGINGGGASAGLEGSSHPLRSVTVMAGETLWQIAEDVAPESDPRDVIAEITDLNQLDAGDIHPGQKLDIPAKYTTGR